MLSEKYPFLIKYFENGIKSKDKNIAQCILFYGNDVQAQYDISLEIARLLNCSGDRSETCDCINCRWLKENKHPAVVTVTKSDNKEADDTTKTVISAAQVKMIRDSLLLSSDFHRVIIFANKNKNGEISGLNKKVFPETAANALLKTFEEPPKNTTFFFLTKDKADVLSTIVSRSQCFFVHSNKTETHDFNMVLPIVENYFNLNRNSVLEFNQKLFEIVKENNPEEVLTEFENYILATIKTNIENIELKNKLIKDIEKVEKAKKELALDMQLQTVIETLCFELIL